MEKTSLIAERMEPGIQIYLLVQQKAKLVLK
jgi:hypothetical protein